MALDTTFTMALVTNYTKTVALANAQQLINYNKKIYYSNGVGAGQADVLWNSSRTLAASATETLDINGSLTDALGNTFSPARIKGIIVSAADGNTNSVVVGGAAGTQWAALLGTAGTVSLRPGSIFAAFASQADATGYVSTGGAADSLKVANSGAGTSVTYDIILIGASA